VVAVIVRLAVEIPGKPRGQGSLTLWRADDGTERAKHPPDTVTHRNLTVGMLRDAWHGEPALGGPVAVKVEAVFVRPKSHYLPANGKRAEPELREDAPEYWVGYPDGDKILRLVDDALTIAGVIGDDALVCIGRIEKRYGSSNLTRVEVWA
jgi:Holliday junction resolvase RusA-like endonuclease